MQTDSIYHKIEIIELIYAERLVLTKLNNIIQYAATYSPFYSERINNRTIRSFEDLIQIPVLDREELVANSPPFSENLLTGPFSAASIYRSGGTSGNPKYTIYSNDEFEYFSEIFARTYFTAGLRPEDRVANLFFCGDLYASFIFVHKLIQVLGCVNFPITGSTLPTTVAEYIKSFGINAILGPTSYIVNLVRILSEQGQGESIQKILYAGEPMNLNDRQFIENALGSSIVIRSAGYGCTDIGLIAYQCPFQSGAIHHTLFDHVYIEIVDPVTKLPLPDGEVGEVLVTSLDKKLMPFIRYRLGDRARKIPEKCECGRTGQLIELVGRQDEIVLKYARQIGAKTIALCCNIGSEIEELADITILTPVGPEIITESARHKGGTAHKMVLDIITTILVIKMGYVYSNIKVGLPTNRPNLFKKGIKYVAEATGCSLQIAEDYLKKANGVVKVAIVMIMNQVDRDEAEKLISAQKGHIEAILG